VRAAALLAIALLAGVAVAAQEGQPAQPGQQARPMTPQAFRAWVEGWTLHFAWQGRPYGTEAFGEDGETLWQFVGDECVRGRWQAEGAQICFSYEDGAGPLCWRFLEDGEGVLARLLGDGPDAGMELRVTRRDRSPLLCGGPSV